MSDITDKLERHYAKVSELIEGDIVRVDPDYQIGSPEKQYEVKRDSKGLYIESDKGNYYLEPFMRSADTYYLGIYRVDK